tara:strand:+ start:77 stop:235 length:159 start_codon:yes stop_codon:yes gene_type:complete
MTAAKIDKSQIDKFKEAARELEADESEANWEKRLKKLTKPTHRRPETKKPQQ